MSDISFYRRSKKGINIDISNRCPLECMRCQRQTNFTLEGRKVYGRDATMDEIEKRKLIFVWLENQLIQINWEK